MKINREDQVDRILNQFVEAKGLNKVKNISIRWVGLHSTTPYQVKVEFDLFVPIDAIMEIQDLLEEKYGDLVSKVEIVTPFQLPIILTFFVPWTESIPMIQSLQDR